MSIVGAFDVHRRQLTFEYLDTVTGELKRGRVAPADREHPAPCGAVCSSGGERPSPPSCRSRAVKLRAA